MTEIKEDEERFSIQRTIRERHEHTQHLIDTLDCFYECFLDNTLIVQSSTGREIAIEMHHTRKDISIELMKAAKELKRYSGETAGIIEATVIKITQIITEAEKFNNRR